MTSTILVTGGAGFIGSGVVRHLVRRTDARVVNLDSLTYAGTLDSVAPVADSPRYAFERADVRDPGALARIFGEHDPDAVIHLAAETHVDRSIDGPADFLTTNVEGTYTVLEAALEHWRGLDAGRRDGFRFLHVSTDEVFGSVAPPSTATETDPYRPNSPYAASKAAADHVVRAWHRTYDLPTLLTRASNNYGPYQYPEKLIPHMILRAREGRELPVYGDGRQVRDWLHVEDHVRALLTVLREGTPGETYNVSAEDRRENLEVVRAVCDALDDLRPREEGRSHRERIAFVEDRPGHDRRYALDASRIREALGWRPRVGFEAGLRETVTWYLEHEAWWRGILDRGYSGDRIGTGAS